MLDIHQTDWLDRAMRSACIRTGELAEASGVSRSQIQRIRNGMSPRLDTLKALESALSALGSQKAAA